MQNDRLIDIFFRIYLEADGKRVTPIAIASRPPGIHKIIYHINTHFIAEWKVHNGLEVNSD